MAKQISAPKGNLSSKNQAVLESMKASLATGKPVEGAKLVVEEEYGENPLDSLMNKVNEAIQQDVCEVDAFAEDLRKSVERRTNAYIVRGLVNQAFALMENDPKNPLAVLREEYRELAQQVDVATRVAGGIKVSRAPIKATIRVELDELEKKIKHIKNVVSNTIAKEYGLTADEAFSIVRDEQKLLEEQAKAYENAQKTK